MNKITVADIFSGCGGFTAGFSQLRRFKPVLAADNWAVALDTLKVNNPNVDCFEGDLSRPAEFQRLSSRLGGVDILLGGPPCQGFSTLGKRRDGDARSTLVDVFADLVLSVKPAIVLVENVRGITTKRHPRSSTYAQALIERLSLDAKTPYNCSFRVLNTFDFGLPQNRIRWFLIAVRADLLDDDGDVDRYWDLLKSYDGSAPKTVRHAIGDLPTVAAGESVKELDGKPLFNHQAMKHSEALIERLACIPQNGGLPDVPRHLLTPHLLKMLDGGYGSGGHVKNIYGRLDWTLPSGTIVAGIDKITCGRFVHPEQNRLLTPRECARLQTFEDKYEIKGGQVAQYYQIGNAVPPLMSKILAVGILKFIDKYMSNGIEGRLVEAAA